MLVIVNSFEANTFKPVTSYLSPSLLGQQGPSYCVAVILLITFPGPHVPGV